MYNVVFLCKGNVNDWKNKGNKQKNNNLKENRNKKPMRYNERINNRMGFYIFLFTLYCLSDSGALSMRSMNWSSLGVMIIWVRRLRCL